MGHRASYHDTGRSHWWICTCGQRSRQFPTKPEAESNHDEHRKDTP